MPSGPTGPRRWPTSRSSSRRAWPTAGASPDRNSWTASPPSAGPWWRRLWPPPRASGSLGTGPTWRCPPPSRPGSWRRGPTVRTSPTPSGSPGPSPPGSATCATSGSGPGPGRPPRENARLSRTGALRHEPVGVLGDRRVTDRPARRCGGVVAALAGLALAGLVASGAWADSPTVERRVHRPGSHSSVSPRATSAPTGLTPDQVKQAYKFPTAADAGAGQTVAVVAPFDDPNIEADLHAFSQAFR